MPSYAFLIPARMSSSRMPGKNFTEFNGQVLLDKTVEFASKFDYPIYVSTDYIDWKFKKRVTLIERPHALARDETDMRLVVEHAREKIKEDVIILLQPTSPLRTKGMIKYCINQFEETNKNIVTINKILKPDGRCFIFPKERYIWDFDIFCVKALPKTADFIDIDYIWDFRIAEAIERGDYS